MGPKQKPWGTPHSKLNIYWYLLCAKYVCARYLLCAKYLFLTFRRCSRGRHGCRHWQQWIKNEKSSIQIFFSTRQTRNFRLKILRLRIRVFISYYSRVSSVLFHHHHHHHHHHYLRYCLVNISLLPSGVVVGDGIVVGAEKLKRTICNPNNICKQDIFYLVTWAFPTVVVIYPVVLYNHHHYHRQHYHHHHHHHHHHHPHCQLLSNK